MQNKIKDSQNKQSSNNPQVTTPMNQVQQTDTKHPKQDPNVPDSKIQPTLLPASSAVLAIISLVLAGVSMIPLLGFLSIFSIILAIGSFVVKERKLMSFLAFVFGLIGLATSPLVWGSMALYIECKFFNCQEKFEQAFEKRVSSDSFDLNLFKIESTSTTKPTNVY